MRLGKDSIEDVLGDEIKREIAERYFTFRKFIEDEKLDFFEKLDLETFVLETRIGFDLVRIYILLNDEHIIRAFLKLVGLERRLYYDPYLTESENIRGRVFEGFRSSGITRYRRFKHLVFDNYQLLERHVGLYNGKMKELEDDLETINEEIRQFYEKTDLTAILGFFRSLDAPAESGHMAGGIETNIAGELDQRLSIESMEPLTHYLEIIPPVAPYEDIRRKLSRLARRAYKLHTEEAREFLGAKAFPAVQRHQLPPVPGS